MCVGWGGSELYNFSHHVPYFIRKIRFQSKSLFIVFLLVSLFLLISSYLLYSILKICPVIPIITGKREILKWSNILAGYFIPDIVVAATIGVVTSVCVGPLIPVCGHWLARSSILQFLLQLIVIGLAVSSQFFPYSMAAPKRVVLQQTYLTSGIKTRLKYSLRILMRCNDQYSRPTL